MRLTIIVDDGVAGVDGVFRQVDLSSLDPAIRAVQWYGIDGHIEYENSSNSDLDSIAEFQYIIDLWNAAAPPSVPPLVLTPADHIRTAHNRINSAYEQAVNQLTAGYPAVEIASWPKQESEARAFLADPAASVPWLIAAAAQRGIHASDLAALIIGNADALAPLHGELTGKRQRLRDQIDALGPDPALDVLAQIVW